MSPVTPRGDRRRHQLRLDGVLAHQARENP
jgi:hypothetical protein